MEKGGVSAKEATIRAMGEIRFFNAVFRGLSERLARVL